MKSTPQKLHVYEILYSLNQAFEQVLTELARLREFPFRHGHLRGVQVLVEETRAWANFELVEVMQGREQDDWTRFGQLRRRWDKRYQDPDDIVSAATGLKRKRAKPADQGRAKGSKGAGHV